MPSQNFILLNKIYKYEDIKMKAYKNTRLTKLFFLTPLALLLISTSQQLSAKEIVAEQSQEIQQTTDSKKTQINSRGRVVKSKIFTNNDIETQEPVSNTVSDISKEKITANRSRRYRVRNNFNQMKANDIKVKKNCTKLQVRKNKCGK